MEKNPFSPLSPVSANPAATVSQTDSAEIEAVVYYRTPHNTTFTKLIQRSQPKSLASLQELPLTGGYIIMPFVVTDDCPILFVEPDVCEEAEVTVPPYLTCDSVLSTDEEEQHRSYLPAFESAHNRLLRHELQKVVLSRRLNLHIGQPTNETEAESTLEGNPDTDLSVLLGKGHTYFLQACHYRPNSFVSFWWTRKTGAWLVATPEPLLENHHHNWGTVALAGTMPWIPGEKAQWNEKNKEEQAIVKRFIEAQLKDIVSDLQPSETYSLHTGNIQHLCTDFRFGLTTDEAIREVLIRLHPTPAVCGLPRCEARQAILEDEPLPRRYYAGFSGPIKIKDETHLYVSLRCMEFTPSTATLYSGGGIMPGSIESEEWEETQRKMQTMRQLFLTPAVSSRF